MNKILKMMLNFYGTIYDMCAKRRLRSACASAQSDQSLRCALSG